jgi:hypothetical protein
MAWLCKSRKRCDAILMQDDLYVFRGARGDLIKILWHDGLGMSLYAKRLDLGGSFGHRPRKVRCRSLRPSGLYAGRYRLAKSAIDVATRERRLSWLKLLGGVYFWAPQITGFVILLLHGC